MLFKVLFWVQLLCYCGAGCCFGCGLGLLFWVWFCAVNTYKASPLNPNMLSGVYAGVI